jgi:Tfp pilus assembly protein PilF
MACANAFGAPFVPTDDNQFLERLPRAAAPVGAELRDLRARSGDVAASIELAQKFVTLGSEDSDPRYFGYAAGVLAPFWKLAEPPAKALLLRAMIAQNRHDFDGALADVDAVIKSDPANLQAWLMRAAISKVLGHLDEARASCAPLAASSEPLLTVACVCDAASLMGGSREAAEALEQTLEERPKATAERQRWALTILAEIVARRGEAQRAERAFKKALEAAKPTAYLLASYADFLLDEERFADAAALLAGEARIDAALLRLALAEQRLGAEGLAEHVSQIEERFTASRRRGEAFHLGDEARFTLYLLRDPARALRLAEQNWRVQRTPADARILYESAVASGDADAARKAQAFLTRAGMSEERLTRLSDQAWRATTQQSGR